jgi:hypothetical protein
MKSGMLAAESIFSVVTAEDVTDEAGTPVSKVVEVSEFEAAVQNSWIAEELKVCGKIVSNVFVTNA